MGVYLVFIPCFVPQLGITVFFQFVARLIVILIHFGGSKFLRTNKEKVIIFLSSVERKTFLINQREPSPLGSHWL